MTRKWPKLIRFANYTLPFSVLVLTIIKREEFAGIDKTLTQQRVIDMFLNYYMLVTCGMSTFLLGFSFVKEVLFRQSVVIVSTLHSAKKDNKFEFDSRIRNNFLAVLFFLILFFEIVYYFSKLHDLEIFQELFHKQRQEQ